MVGKGAKKTASILSESGCGRLLHNLVVDWPILTQVHRNQIRRFPPELAEQVSLRIDQKSRGDLLFADKLDETIASELVHNFAKLCHVRLVVEVGTHGLFPESRAISDGVILEECQDDFFHVFVALKSHNPVAGSFFEKCERGQRNEGNRGDKPFHKCPYQWVSISSARILLISGIASQKSRLDDLRRRPYGFGVIRP